MRISLRRLITAGIVVCCIAVTGCDSGTTNKPKSNPPSASSGGAGPNKSNQSTDADDHAHGTALSDEDQALADAQRICPVTGEEFSEEMGPPVKLVINDQPVFICCKQCTKKAMADPEKTLAKVAELKKKAKQEPDKQD